MSRIAAHFETLRGHALALPEAIEEFPWGHSAIKVRGKTFLFLNQSEDELSLSVKLPASRDFALIFDWAEPTGYGLGRSGWVTARFGAGDEPDLDLIRRWIVESYKAIAPKTLARMVAVDEADAS